MNQGKGSFLLLWGISLLLISACREESWEDFEERQRAEGQTALGEPALGEVRLMPVGTLGEAQLLYESMIEAPADKLPRAQLADFFEEQGYFSVARLFRLSLGAAPREDPDPSASQWAENPVDDRVGVGASILRIEQMLRDRRPREALDYADEAVDAGDTSLAMLVAWSRAALALQAENERAQSELLEPALRYYLSIVMESPVLPREFAGSRAVALEWLSMQLEEMSNRPLAWAAARWALEQAHQEGVPAARIKAMERREARLSR